MKNEMVKKGNITKVVFKYWPIVLGTEVSGSAVLLFFGCQSHSVLSLIGLLFSCILFIATIYWVREEYVKKCSEFSATLNNNAIGLKGLEKQSNDLKNYIEDKLQKPIDDIPNKLASYNNDIVKNLTANLTEQSKKLEEQCKELSSNTNKYTIEIENLKDVFYNQLENLNAVILCTNAILSCKESFGKVKIYRKEYDEGRKVNIIKDNENKTTVETLMDENGCIIREATMYNTVTGETILKIAYNKFGQKTRTINYRSDGIYTTEFDEATGDIKETHFNKIS